MPYPSLGDFAADFPSLSGRGACAAGGEGFGADSLLDRSERPHLDAAHGRGQLRYGFAE